MTYDELWRDLGPDCPCRRCGHIPIAHVASAGGAHPWPCQLMCCDCRGWSQ